MIDKLAMLYRSPQDESCLISILKTKLPLELLLRLTDFLDRDSLLQLRLSCRDLERVLFHIFVKRFFSRRDIRPYIETIAIRYVHNVDRDLCAVFSSGADKDLLEKAFSRLPNLRTIILRYPSSSPNSNVFSLDVRMYRVTAYAISRTNLDLDAFMVEESGGPGGGLNLLGLELPDAERAIYESGLHRVKSLALALSPRIGAHQTLTNFLRPFTNLSFLRINLDRSHPGSCRELMKPMFVPPLPNLSTVRELQLGKMMVTPQTLVATINAFAPNLESLTLYRLGLFDEAGHWGTGTPFDNGVAPTTLPNLARFNAKFLTERATKSFVSFRLADATSPRGYKDMTWCSFRGSDFHAFARNTISQLYIPPLPPIVPLPVHQDDEDDEDDEDDGDGLSEDEDIDMAAQ
ncbi:unnamed protein product [Parascedosporium putredinis]|uniref:F-box domain-containing protein n=1 Tax=Parascedosporium putredinis TaxID=1442378 RepID=A0A9P1H7K9_9PEZI|nr:unnamed protein product [Parascedosporium putredinis]CAI7998743.1 unnamed protein product [Parascedosporium putredinis]